MCNDPILPLTIMVETLYNLANNNFWHLLSLNITSNNRTNVRVIKLTIKYTVLMFWSYDTGLCRAPDDLSVRLHTCNEKDFTQHLQRVPNTECMPMHSILYILDSKVRVVTIALMSFICSMWTTRCPGELLKPWLTCSVVTVVSPASAINHADLLAVDVDKDAVRKHVNSAASAIPGRSITRGRTVDRCNGSHDGSWGSGRWHRGMTVRWHRDVTGRKARILANIGLNWKKNEVWNILSYREMSAVNICRMCVGVHTSVIQQMFGVTIIHIRKCRVFIQVTGEWIAKVVG